MELLVGRTLGAVLGHRGLLLGPLPILRRDGLFLGGAIRLGLGRSHGRGSSAIDAGKLATIAGSGPLMGLLHRCRLDMALIGELPILCRGLGLDTTPPTVVAYTAAIKVIVRHRPIDIGVVNASPIHIGHGGVIGKMSPLPTATVVAIPVIAAAVINPAVITAMVSPITGMENKGASAPTPVTGCPIESHRWWQHPGPRHPIIAIGTVSPIARGPHIAVTGTSRLGVDRKNRWSNIDRHKDRREGG